MVHSSDKKPALLLTGASGFLGRSLTRHLASKFELTTLGRSAGNEVVSDLGVEVPALPKRFEVVVHNAGKAHVVPRTQEEKEAFFRVNLVGTRHLIEALGRAQAPPRSFVYISSVAVYGREEGEQIDESYPLKGETPYARSKIEAEAALQHWCTEQSVSAVVLRLPLVVGPGAPGNLGAMRRAIERGYYFRISGNTARRSAVLAEDVAALIPSLVGKAGVYNLTDGVHPCFADIETALEQAVGKRIPLSVSLRWVKITARVGDLFARAGLPALLTTAKLEKMTSTLTFSDARARQELGWDPRPVVPYIRTSL